MPAKHAANPSCHVIGPPKSDNADEIVAASSETKLSKTIAIEARSDWAIILKQRDDSHAERSEAVTQPRIDFAEGQPRCLKAWPHACISLQRFAQQDAVS